MALQRIGSIKNFDSDFWITFGQSGRSFNTALPHQILEAPSYEVEIRVVEPHATVVLPLGKVRELLLHRSCRWHANGIARELNGVGVVWITCGAHGRNYVVTRSDYGVGNFSQTLTLSVLLVEHAFWVAGARCEIRFDVLGNALSHDGVELDIVAADGQQDLVNCIAPGAHCSREVLELAGLTLDGDGSAGATAGSGCEVDPRLTCVYIGFRSGSRAGEVQGGGGCVSPIHRR